MVKTHRDLQIWQKAMQLVTKVYQAVDDFPGFEKFGLISQIRRSSVSVPANIAEGFGRRSKKDFRRFLNISMGSLFELQTELEVSFNLGFLEEELFKELYSDTREIERMMSSFISTL
ncbi:four helix bundle protein [Gracilimonas sediminicola]|uniref:Four helix bundle protein n=1 Tax=Gracilimonas sediminicola TaxID=2952158 RepID=A0A9X2RC65_9BACT|nr:four helix bundle protein [Gracilimonas sediminicola]MCP9290636.1 four helix bundle protein [Gracilimonas sediminicola]